MLLQASNCDGVVTLVCSQWCRRGGQGENAPRKIVHHFFDKELGQSACVWIEWSERKERVCGNVITERLRKVRQHM